MVPKEIIYDKNEGIVERENKAYSQVDKSEIKDTLNWAKEFVKEGELDTALTNIKNLFEFVPEKDIPREAVELEYAIHVLKQIREIEDQPGFAA